MWSWGTHRLRKWADRLGYQQSGKWTEGCRHASGISIRHSCSHSSEMCDARPNYHYLLSLSAIQSLLLSIALFQSSLWPFSQPCGKNVRDFSPAQDFLFPSIALNHCSPCVWPDPKWRSYCSISGSELPTEGTITLCVDSRFNGKEYHRSQRTASSLQYLKALLSILNMSMRIAFTTIISTDYNDDVTNSSQIPMTRVKSI